MRGRNNNNNNNNRKGPNPLTRSYESNGPDVKIRGSAQQIAEKYTTLARDAMSSGDRVIAENYLQHAEHYNRIIAAAQAQMPIQQFSERGDEDEFDEERDEFDPPSFGMPPQHQGGENRGNQNGEGRDRHEQRGDNRADGRNGQSGDRSDNRGQGGDGRERNENRGDNRERGFNGPRGDRPERFDRENRGDRQDRHERRDRNGERDFNRQPDAVAPAAPGQADASQPAAERALAVPPLNGDAPVAPVEPALNGGVHAAADGTAEGETRRPRRPRRPRSRPEGEDARNPAAIAAAVEQGDASEGSSGSELTPAEG
jgi:hypothetical protein